MEEIGFDGIAPLPKEILFTIVTARNLPRVVKYYFCERKAKMQVANPKKPNRLIKFLVSSLMILDGLSVLGLGLLFLILAALADPIDFSIEAKEANFLRGQVVAIVAFIYFLLSIISTIYWNMRFRAWGFIMLGLGILHLPVSFFVILARRNYEDFPAFLFYVPIILDLVLIAIVIFGKAREELHNP